MLNLHQVFYKFLDDKCFLHRLDVHDADKKLLLAARKKIRDRLRAGIAAATRKLGDDKVVHPRFLTQGSWVYRTLNDPAHCPPQHIDLDDGVYLPMSLLNGTAPSVACKVFFGIVDTLLEQLAKEHGWRLDKTKDTCTRIIIGDRAHIDIPLYAIPDSEFQQLTEAAARYGYSTIEDAVRKSDSNSWIWLSSDRIWLAIRGGEWQQSDPRKVHEWFERLKAVYGDQFVRVCRYLKAWRDYHWQNGGPSSILLMVCASLEFKKHADRDDLALLHVIRRLGDHVDGDVYDREIESQVNNLDVANRKVASTRARQFASVLDQATQNTAEADAALRLLTAQLGHRVPNMVALVTEDRAAVVQSTPKAVVAAQPIQRVRAG